MSQLSNCKIISIVVTFIFLYLKASMDLQHLSTKYYRDTHMGFHSDHSSQHRQELLSSEWATTKSALATEKEQVWGWGHRSSWSVFVSAECTFSKLLDKALHCPSGAGLQLGKDKTQWYHYKWPLGKHTQQTGRFVRGKHGKLDRIIHRGVSLNQDLELSS